MIRLQLFRLRMALCLLGLMAAIPGYAAVVTSTGSGNWSNAAVWDVGVPGAGDDVIIATGHTVTVNLSAPQFNGVTVNSGGKLTVNFAGTIFINGNIANNGDIEMVDGLLTGNGTDRLITNGSGGTITLDNSSFDGAGSIDLLNQGLFVKRGLNNGFVDFHGTFTNEASATVQVNATKAMSFAGDFINNGTVNLITNSSLRFLGANVTVNTGSSITQLSPANGNLVFGGTVNVTGNTDFLIEIPIVSHGGATLVGSGIGMVVDAGVTYNMDNGWIDGFTSLTNNGTMDLSGVVVKRITMDVTNNGTFNFSDGVLSTNGPTTTFTNTATGTLALNGGNIDFISFVNQGVTNLSQNQAISTNFDNQSAGTVNLANLQTNSVSADFINDGVVAGNGSMSLVSPGLLSGTGSFTGANLITIAAGATMSPGQSPGCMSFAGNYSQSGTLEIEVNGTTACTDFDQITVGGTASLSGTLDANISGTYATGTIITFIDAGAVSGTFSTVTPALPADWAVMYDYPNAGEVSLEFTGGPAPALDFNVGVENSGPSNTVIVPIWVNNFDGIVNYQGTIVFDPAVLTFVEATSPQIGGPVIVNNFGEPGQGTIPTNSITFLWADLLSTQQTLTDGTFVINVEFTVNANATTGFTPVSIDGSVTPLGYSDDPNGISLLTPTVQNGGVNIDADPPVTVDVNIESNNANDITLATVADVITLSFTTDETPAITPVVTITKGGAGAITVTGSGTTWTATKTVAAGDDGLVTFDIELEDQYGNTSNTTATTDGSSVTVDTEVPVITCPANVPQNTDAGLCSADVTYADATATDNLAGVSVAHTGGPVSGSTFPVGTTAITYVATDAAGNTSTCSFDVIVTDNEAPTVVTQPVTVQLDAAGSASVTAAQVDNGSSDACGIASTSLDITSFDCSNTGANTVTLTVTDNNGNVSTGTAVVTVEDNIAPTIVCPGPQTLNTDLGLCTATLPDLTGLATVDDNCPGGGGNVNANTASQMAVGYYHTLSIADDGTLWAWGRNDNGQLGTGTASSVDQTTPLQVSTATDWAAVAGGYFHSVALKTDGTLWAWGQNSYGQLGIGNTTQQNSPTQIGTATDWVSVRSGYNHCVAIKADGTLWAWGQNVNGQLGIGNTTQQTSPIQVGTDTDWILVDAGYSHTVALKSNGTAWAWGYNADGRLGIGSTLQQNNPSQVGTDTDWASVSAGYNHSAGLKSNGTLWTWGGNPYGELGNGTTGGNQTSPIQVGSDTDWAVAEAGSYHTMALKSTGTLWVWGIRTYSIIGDGNTSGQQTTPLQVGTNTNWTQFAEGCFWHVIASQSDNSLYGWGFNSDGQVGDGSVNYYGASLPVAVAGFTPGQSAGSGGSGSSLTVTQLPAAGSALALGANTVTITVTDASGNQTSCNVTVTVEDNEAPTVVMQPFTVQLDASGNGSIIADDVDNGSSDPCGIATRTLDISTFDCSNVGTPVTVTMTVTDVNGNSATGTAVITVEDNVAPTVVTQPFTVQLDASGNGSVTVADVNNGSSDACGIASTSLDITTFDCSNVGANTVTLTVTDVNGNSSTGTAVVTVEDNVAPTVVTQPFTAQLDASGSVTITPADVNNGSSDACGIATYALDITSFDCSNTGANTVTLTVTDNNGNVSTGTAVVTVEDNIAPTIVCPGPQTIDTDLGLCTATLPDLTALTTASDNCAGSGGSNGYSTYASTLAAGYKHTLSVAADGTLWAWGIDANGQLGDGSGVSQTQSSPIQISTDINWIAVSAGVAHSLALKSDGTLWAWGSNYSGQIGNGSNTNQFSPLQVGSDTDWAQLAAGNENSFAIKSNGTLWAWGSNNLGQLGVGNTNDQLTPTQVGTDSDWAEVQPGLNHTLAIKTDGTAWTWGNNNFGQLGLGNGSNHTSPVQVGTDTDWLAIESGYYHSIALKSDGTLWTWGSNSQGQLGIGSTTQQSSPVQVGTATDWTTIGVAYTGCYAIKSNGSLWAWGERIYGAIGDGNTSGDQLTPIQVGTSTNWSSLADGIVNFTTLAFQSDGSLYGWGWNTNGQLGIGNFTTQPAPVLVPGFTVSQSSNSGGSGSGPALTQLPAAGSALAVGANTVTITATDASGNATSCSVIVTVEDNEAPTVVTQPFTVQLDVSGNGSIVADDVDNGSSDPCGIATRTLDVSTFDCSNVGTPVTVTMTVTDVNGNVSTGTAVVTVEDNVAPTVVTQPYTVQLDAAGNGSIVVADVNNGSSDACGIASTLLDITSFDCSNVGANTVTLTVTDNNGNVSTGTAVVTVEDNVNPVAMTQAISVDLDGNGTATITPAQIDNGSSDACGIATYALDVTSFDCNTLGANTVTLTVTDNNGNTHSATAVVTVNLVPAAAITGQAATEDNKVVAGVTFDVNGTDGPLTQLGSPAYSFLLTPCTSVNDIGGFKNNDADPKNGIDVQDITKMTRHILNIEALGSPYKLLAADVNHNSLINGPDVTQVRQMVLGVRTGFPTPGATVTNPVTDDYLWSFIPQAHTWVDNTIPWTYPTRIDFLDPVNTPAQDFVGVKLGDVNNTWDETNPLTTWFADSIHMVMQDQSVTPGQLVTIPVMVRDFNAITGYQFSMNWDPGVLSLEAAENVELLGFFNTELAKKGILSTVWNDLAGQPITMEDDAVAFTLTFRVLGDWGAASAITVTSDLTRAIGYNVEEMPLAVIASTVNITVGDVSTSIDPSELEGYAFLQNVPNPFNESTTFTFALPTQEDVKIEIYNAMGQIVRTFEGTYGVGVHELQWDGANSASREVAVGVYSVRIQAGIFQSAINVKKMQ